MATAALRGPPQLIAQCTQCVQRLREAACRRACRPRLEAALSWHNRERARAACRRRCSAKHWTMRSLAVLSLLLPHWVAAAAMAPPLIPVAGYLLRAMILLAESVSFVVEFFSFCSGIVRSFRLWSRRWLRGMGQVHRDSRRLRLSSLWDTDE